MTTPPSPHAVLGIPETATLVEAERAWKKLARALHPDRHKPEEREELGQRLADINAAWSALRASPAPSPSAPVPNQHAVFYTARDPQVAQILSALLALDTRTVRRAWLGALLRGRRPRRAAPLTVVLSSAVVCEGRSATILFEAPLPKGRAAIIVPTLRWSGGKLSVQPERPRAIDIDTPTGMIGQFSPFTPGEVRAAGLESLAVHFPSRPLDITKTVRLHPREGLVRLLYRT